MEKLQKRLSKSMKLPLFNIVSRGVGMNIPNYFGMMKIRKWKVEECTVLTTRYISSYIRALDIGVGYGIRISVRQNETQEIYCVTTACNYGGYRIWFKCPNVLCKARSYKLYKIPNADCFCCRHCANVTYDSRFVPKITQSKFAIFIIEARLMRALDKVKMT